MLALAIQGTILDEPVRLPIYLADALDCPARRGQELTYHYRLSGEGLDLAVKAAPGSKSMASAIESQLPSAGNGKTTQAGRKSWLLQEKEGRTLFSRIVADRFAALQVGQFDFVVGNPAWVKWSNLPTAYRERVKSVCDHYDLFSDDAWVGGIESDISTVLLYAAADRWLKPQGRLGYLITQTVFKTRSSDGFRRFRLPDKTALNVTSVDDMVALRPFEDAQNRTAAIFLTKGRETSYPVLYRVWRRNGTRVRLSMRLSLAEVLDRSRIDVHEAEPADKADGPWLTAPEGRLDLLRSVMGGKGVPARKGTTPDFNNIYWFKVEGADKRNKVLRVTNNLSAQGHQVPQETLEIEADILYPMAKGKEVTRFNFSGPSTWILLPHPTKDSDKAKCMAAFPAAQMKDRFPLAYGYLSKYLKSACTGDCKSGSGCRLGLEERASYKRYGKGMGAPWAIWNVGEYSFSPFKVAWKEIGGFEAAVLSSAANALGQERVVVPDHKLMFMSCETES
ncbi:MAG: Eco57I restriction-modification methylase domain-containing protein, partial [Myxococcota bacterium]